MIIISIHIFPQELSEYARVIESLNHSYDFVNLPNDFCLFVTLNDNKKLVDTHPTSDYIDRFHNINSTSKFKGNFRLKQDDWFLGVNEHRVDTINLSKKEDAIIFLDSDMYCNPRILAHLENANSVLVNKHKHYIITPNTVRLWDTTWDCIVNEKFKDNSHDFYKNINAEQVTNYNYGKVGLVPNNTFKWGGGWYNCISSKLLRKISIPKTFKGYGPDDTFIMHCCKLMKAKSHDVQQYILKNMVVCESPNPIKTEPLLRSDIPDFRYESNKHFHTEINKFYKKL